MALLYGPRLPPTLLVAKRATWYCTFTCTYWSSKRQLHQEQAPLSLIVGSDPHFEQQQPDQQQLLLLRIPYPVTMISNEPQLRGQQRMTFDTFPNPLADYQRVPMGRSILLRHDTHYADGPPTVAQMIQARWRTDWEGGACHSFERMGMLGATFCGGTVSTHPNPRSWLRNRGHRTWFSLCYSLYYIHFSLIFYGNVDLTPKEEKRWTLELFKSLFLNPITL